MDDRIIPGIIPINQRILRECRKYLGISKEDLDSRRADVSAWRTLVMILLQKYNPNMILADVAGMVDREHSMACVVNKKFRNDYTGDIQFKNYIYLNVIAVIDSKKCFSINDLIKDSVEKFPIEEKQKEDAMKMVNKEIKSEICNPAILAFVQFFMFEGLSGPEIRNILHIHKNISLHYLPLKDKQVFMDAIRNTIKFKLWKLKEKS